MKIAINTSAIESEGLDLGVFETLGECKFFGEIPRSELFKL